MRRPRRKFVATNTTTGARTVHRSWRAAYRATEGETMAEAKVGTMGERLVAARAEAVRHARAALGRDLTRPQLEAVIEDADAEVGEQAFREGGQAWVDWNMAMLDFDDDEEEEGG